MVAITNSHAPIVRTISTQMCENANVNQSIKLFNLNGSSFKHSKQLESLMDINKIKNHALH
jgi:hypothetical protein